MNQNWNLRDISALVRQALQLLYDSQTGKTGNTLAGDGGRRRIRVCRLYSLLWTAWPGRNEWIANGMNGCFDAGQASVDHSATSDGWRFVPYSKPLLCGCRPAEVIAETRDHASVSVPPVVVICAAGIRLLDGVIPENKTAG